MSTAIWVSDQADWKQLQPTGFKDEKALHDLVEEAPHLLPLSGAPQLAVVGREVALGTNYADLLAIEPSGRVVVIEIKLAYNAEARRAVVAQILAYAAYLHRLDPEELVRTILGRHLTQRGYESLVDAVVATAQDPSFDAAEFDRAFRDNLATGRFRLVLVLDSVPQELVQLVGYLGVVAPELTLDLVSVSAYDIEGTRALVPQRVDPERVDPASSPTKLKAAAGQFVDGGGAFEKWIREQPVGQAAVSVEVLTWARSLEQRGLARLKSFQSLDVTTLMIYPATHDGSLASAWKDRIYLYRSVFDKVAPGAIPRVEAAVAPNRFGQGTVVPNVNDEVMAALTAAYEMAAG